MLRGTEAPMDFERDHPVKTNTFCASNFRSSTFNFNPKTQASSQFKPFEDNSETFVFGQKRKKGASNFCPPTLPPNTPKKEELKSHEPSESSSPNVKDASQLPDTDQSIPIFRNTHTRLIKRRNGHVVKKIVRGWSVAKRDHTDDEDEDLDDNEEVSLSYNGGKINRAGILSVPELPIILGGWLQLVFNLFLLTIVIWIIVQVISTVKADVDMKVAEFSVDIMNEIAECTKHYLENRCAPVTRVPAMEKACTAWDNCMNRDPTKVGRTQVGAQTFAEIIERFVEKISYKTMLFFSLLTFGAFFFSNLAFAWSRRRYHVPSHHQQPLPHAPMPPPYPYQTMMPPYYPASPTHYHPISHVQTSYSPRTQPSPRRRLLHLEKDTDDDL
ncbi:Di-sulfide bridge nucleocytoplasmic transport domain-containing protein [Paraphysoderma sedebokerense]|nr:Di-sulfide bridge nucleocytoplasmic transport domain-containing protein [Paraphysoderma sedebokerense]